MVWSEDGKDGKDDTNNSEALVVNWLCSSNNYKLYCGNTLGKTKIAFAKELADSINAKGVLKRRTAEDVKKKITQLEQQFKSAWALATTEIGAGLRSQHDISFDAKLKERCRYFFELEPVMLDRSKMRPKVTSDSLNEDDNNIDVPMVVDVAGGNSSSSISSSSSSNNKCGHQTERKRAIAMSPTASVSTPKKSKFAAIEDQIQVLVDSLLAKEGKKAPASSTVLPPVQRDTDLDTTERNIRLFGDFNKIKAQTKMTDAQLVDVFPSFARFVPQPTSTGPNSNKDSNSNSTSNGLGMAVSTGTTVDTGTDTDTGTGADIGTD